MRAVFALVFVPALLCCTLNVTVVTNHALSHVPLVYLNCVPVP